MKIRANEGKRSQIMAFVYALFVGTAVVVGVNTVAIWILAVGVALTFLPSFLSRPALTYLPSRSSRPEDGSED